MQDQTLFRSRQPRFAYGCEKVNVKLVSLYKARRVHWMAENVIQFQEALSRSCIREAWVLFLCAFST